MISFDVTVRFYETAGGQTPAQQWLDSLEKPALVCVLRRLRRVETGNFGECRSLQGEKGLFELKEVRFGGLRVYFGQRGSLVLILWGGNKKSQAKDIRRAILYWREAQTNF